MNMNISSSNIHVFMNIIHIYIDFPLLKKRVKSTSKIAKLKFVLYILIFHCLKRELKALLR
jgi:hypothetical protein